MLLIHHFMHKHLFKGRLRIQFCCIIKPQSTLFFMKKTFLLIAVSLSLFACDKEKNKANVFKSDEVAVHGGKAWSTITLDKKDVPQQLSLVLDDAVLNSVPIGGIGDGHDGMHGNDLFVPLHSKALATT